MGHEGRGIIFIAIFCYCGVGFAIFRTHASARCWFEEPMLPEIQAFSLLMPLPAALSAFRLFLQLSDLGRSMPPLFSREWLLIHVGVLTSTREDVKAFSNLVKS
uniref:Uncharacterized protein n=1 Tax=Physcomitrium patens TaxID=3218 RepID=A0A7I3ZAZ4_PHYPA